MTMPNFGELSRKLVTGRHISGGNRKSLSSVKYSHRYGTRPKCAAIDVTKMAVANDRAIGGAAQ